MKNNHLIGWIRVMVIICGVALISVLFFPMWKIELNAPQYPEGLVLKIYPNKIGGNVDIVNGLNHYIGMKTLHTKDFIEFTILPYIISFFALLCFVTALLNRKNWLVALSALFTIFGIVAMYDFWRWEYNYGHDLNPEAAIQIPGMAYQPPLIGYKQLLNFGAYSIPDIGGFIFLGVGVLLLLAAIVQIRYARKHKIQIKKGALALSIGFILFTSCNAGPQPIKLGIDACSFCKMTIADNRFGGEVTTKKGKAYKFDDIHCLLEFNKSNFKDPGEINQIYFTNFTAHDLIQSPKAFLLKSAELHTPMGGNIAAFTSETDLKKASEKYKGNRVNWQDVVR